MGEDAMRNLLRVSLPMFASIAISGAGKHHADFVLGTTARSWRA